ISFFEDAFNLRLSDTSSIEWLTFITLVAKKPVIFSMLTNSVLLKPVDVSKTKPCLKNTRFSTPAIQAATILNKPPLGECPTTTSILLILMYLYNLIIDFKSCTKFIDRRTGTPTALKPLFSASSYRKASGVQAT